MKTINNLYIRTRPNGTRYFTEAGMHFRQLERLLRFLKVSRSQLPL